MPEVKIEVARVGSGQYRWVAYFADFENKRCVSLQEYGDMGRDYDTRDEAQAAADRWLSEVGSATPMADDV